MLGETVGQLRDQDDEDEIEEQLQERHSPILGAVLVAGRRLPPAPECESSSHTREISPRN
jgi:hypothetical protein